MNRRGEFHIVTPLFIPQGMVWPFFVALAADTFPHRMNRRKADFKFAYKFLEDEV